MDKATAKVLRAASEGTAGEGGPSRPRCLPPTLRRSATVYNRCCVHQKSHAGARNDRVAAPQSPGKAVADKLQHGDPEEMITLHEALALLHERWGKEEQFKGKKPPAYSTLSAWCRGRGGKIEGARQRAGVWMVPRRFIDTFSPPPGRGRKTSSPHRTTLWRRSKRSTASNQSN